MVKQKLNKLPIAFIGAGNLAVKLAQALHQKGFEIVQVFSRTEESAKSLAEKVGARWTVSLEDVTSEAMLYIISLKDSVVVELLPQIVKGKDGALFVHTAGSIPMDIWKGWTTRYGVFYPMQTFSKERSVDFKEVPIFIEAAWEEDTKLLKSIASVLSDKVFEADSQQRQNLHLAAVFACNFTNHMYALTAELLEKYNLPFDVMLPLIDETVRKVHQLSPLEAQTGPAVRGDENVMDKHLDMLVDHSTMHDIYLLLSESIYLTGKQSDERARTNVLRLN